MDIIDNVVERIEPDGLELKPSNPEECPGNGKHPVFECRCENCDFFLDCFPAERE